MTLVFRIAVAVALLHALDDAFVHRGPGLGLGQHALAAAIAVAAAAAAAVAFPRLRPGWRAGLALAFGALALTNGALHLAHIADSGPDGGDLTGALAAAAGVVLIGLAVAIPWRERGRGTVVSRVLAVPLGLIAVVFVLGPMGMGIVAGHKWREPVGDPPSAAYKSVRFHASDGLQLAGWYRPSRNGATVIVLHGGSSDRKGSVAHAQMLARHGYGVLLYDARGRGESEGMDNNYGWDWSKDVAGALAFLKGRDEVDPARIGALGLSTGADVVIEVAGERHDLAAVVADGTAAGSFADWQRLRGTELGTVPGWMMFTTLRVVSGDAPGPPLEDMVKRVSSPTLLISAGTDVEREFNVHYDHAAAGRVEHWNLPDAVHTHAIHSHRDAYERRVVAFFDAAFASVTADARSEGGLVR
ncbi:MAG TPA: alpha/beta fold hydrolase [Solirubrobacteraceae bacterium]|nr:alpha/beta fold hydrolase [Solirubrobacteraceae bacterium]